MTRQEAYEALKEGKRVAHNYFAKGEYYEFKENSIIAEDRVDYTRVFWQTDGNDWRSVGWEILPDNSEQ